MRSPCQARQAGRPPDLLVARAPASHHGPVIFRTDAPSRCRPGRRGRAARRLLRRRRPGTASVRAHRRRPAAPRRRRRPERVAGPDDSPSRTSTRTTGPRCGPSSRSPRTSRSSRRSCSRPTPPRSRPRSPTTARGSTATPTPRCTTGTCWRRRCGGPRRRTSAARVSEIALTDSTTMGLAVMYGGLDLAPGDEILTTTHDFFSTEESLRLVVAADRGAGPRGHAVRRPGRRDRRPADLTAARRDRPPHPGGRR